MRSEIHIRADCGPETVDKVHEKENEEGVEEELGVIGKNVRKIWVFFDECEDGWDEAYFWGLNERDLLFPRTRTTTFPTTGRRIRVRVVVRALLSETHLFIGVPTATFLHAPRYDVSVEPVPRYLASPCGSEGWRFLIEFRSCKLNHCAIGLGEPASLTMLRGLIVIGGNGRGFILGAGGEVNFQRSLRSSEGRVSKWNRRLH